MSTRVDLQELKSTLNLEALVEQVTGQAVRPGHNLRCPFHDDRTPSLHVYPDGRFKCFGCDAHGDVYDFLGLVWYGDTAHLRDVLDRLGEVAPRMPAPERRKPETRPALPGDIVDRFEARMTERELRYWARRGISAHALYSLRVGWTGQRYAFPWIYRGVLTAVKFRRDDEISPELEPKYISAKGSRFAAPYNIDAVTMRKVDICLVVEDEKSVLAAARYHIPAVSAPANAWKPEWSAMIGGVGRVIIVADKDEPGRASAAKIAETLRTATVTEVPEGKDLYDFHEYLLRKIGDFNVMKNTLEDWLGL